MKCGHPILMTKIDNILKNKLMLQATNGKVTKGDNISKKKDKNRKKKPWQKKENGSPPPKKQKIKFSSAVEFGNNNERVSKSNLDLKNNKDLLHLRSKNKRNKEGTKKNKALSKNSKNNKFLKKNSSSLKKDNLKDLPIEKNFNDYELNTMDYEKAKLNDKRTCCQYYASLLKMKQPILFAFFPTKDYNSKIIKVGIFILSFAMNYVINFMLEYKNIAHNIYMKGKYDIIDYIIYIIISFIITHIITILLRLIFLSEGNIAEIRKQKTPFLIKSTTSEAKQKIKIKYILFFIICFLFFGIFWLVMSSFGAVYQNTQFSIFENALIGYGMCLIYPFFISLFPCIFRMSSINSKEKKECMYSFSLFLQIL